MTTNVARESTVVTGIGVGRGYAIAPLALLQPAPTIPASAQRHDGDAAAAGNRAAAALQEVGNDLRRQAEDATGAVADVLAATAAIAGDPALLYAALGRTAAGDSPAQAVTAAVEQFATVFLAAGGLMAERVTDLRSIRDRAVAHLLGLPAPGLHLTQTSVVGAVDLSPADTAALNTELVAAIVTEQGGPTGHTAINAAQLGIPCIVRATGLTPWPAGELVAVDAVAGTVTAAPSDEVIDRLRARDLTEQALSSDIADGATADGHPIKLFANIGTLDEAVRLRDNAIEGVGLLRTEVLFLGNATEPLRSDQEPTYRAIIDALRYRKIVVRTLDAGADKPLEFADLPPADNPALGARGYRLDRTDPTLINEQIAALGAVVTALPEVDRDRVWVMAPMISTPGEAADFAARARSHGIARVGVMVEVPAAALRADAILAEVDFVSLGTNDLAQYTMASDRLCGELADLLSPWQPALLDLVAATAAAGRRADKPVGVCGESASDPLMALALVGFGVTSLSMSVSAAPAVRYALRRHTQAQRRHIAARHWLRPPPNRRELPPAPLLTPRRSPNSVCPNLSAHRPISRRTHV